jgi:hypothetical protein
MMSKTTRNQTTFGRDGNVRHKGTVVGSYVRHQGEFEHAGEVYTRGIVATLDQGEVIAEESDYRARRAIETALRERLLPTPEERVQMVVDYLDTMEIVALDIEGAEVERGQGSDGWEKDPTAHWLTVRTPHARVEVRASFNKHGGWNREPGVFALGDTLYEDAEGTWRTFTRRGIEDSFYDDDGSQAETLLGTQLERAEAARERSKANVGKWVTIPGAPRRVHQDDLPKIKAALEAGRTRAAPTATTATTPPSPRPSASTEPSPPRSTPTRRPPVTSPFEQ